MTATDAAAVKRLPDPLPVVAIRGVTKSFGTNRVLAGVDLDVHKGEVVSVIGPSGSGKTTLLRCINFLESYDGGSIKVDGVEVGYRDDGRRRQRSERELAKLRNLPSRTTSHRPACSGSETSCGSCSPGNGRR